MVIVWRIETEILVEMLFMWWVEPENEHGIVFVWRNGPVY